MASTSNSIFTGTSRYSQDFQNVITRATAIASLPISALNNDKTALDSQSGAITTLNATFTKLQSAIQGIQDALGGSSYGAAVSDLATLSVTLGDGAVEGSYSVEVLDPGARATSITTASWVADTAVHDYQLSFGGQTYAIDAADNSAAGVAAAINTQYGDRVSAAVVNVGTGAAPDLRISLQAATLGDTQPDILDGNTSLQSQQVAGARAHYIVDGQGAGVFSSSDSIEIAQGIHVNLKASSAGPVSITVTRSTTALSDALSVFTAAYNSAVDAVDQQHGQTGGALVGNPLISGLSQMLSQLAGYSSTDQIGGLKGLGLELSDDNSGHLSFNSFAMLAADLTSPSAVVQFLGSSLSGGFLKSATDLLNSVETAATGLIASAQAGIQTRIADIDSRIADQQSRIDNMTAQMQARMSQADALIASMEQQYQYLYGMFQAMQTAAQQFK